MRMHHTGRASPSRPPHLTASHPTPAHHHISPSRWYKKKHGKPFRHFFRKGYKQRVHIKIKAKRLSPLGHYCTQGWKEGRRLWARTAMGAFDGVLDVEAFLEVNKHDCMGHRERERDRETRVVFGTIEMCAVCRACVLSACRMGVFRNACTN